MQMRIKLYKNINKLLYTPTCPQCSCGPYEVYTSYMLTYFSHVFMNGSSVYFWNMGAGLGIPGLLLYFLICFDCILDLPRGEVLYLHSCSHIETPPSLLNVFYIETPPS